MYISCKKILLLLELIKFRIINQGFSWFFTSFVTTKIFLCPKIKKILRCWTSVFQVFSLSMNNKRMFLTLEKKTLPLEVFWYFHIGIFVWLKGLWSVLVFSRFVFNFFIKKLLARVSYVQASEWRPCYSGAACDTTRWSNLVIHCLSGCAAMSSFT